MRKLFTGFVIGGALMTAGGALAQQEELPLRNWTAPPFWNVASSPQADDASRAADVQPAGIETQSISLPSTPVPFVAVTPCRIVDTRVPVSDGFHQPDFSNNQTRTFPLPASPNCTGIPTTAVAYSLNVQYRTNSFLTGTITLFATGTPMPVTALLTGNTLSWTADAAIVAAGNAGAIDVHCQVAGKVVIDINGYYLPENVVNTLNGLTGDVTLLAGSNVTITPSGNTLTIAAAGGGGGSLPPGSPDQTLYDNGSGWVASSALTNDGTDVGIANNLLLPSTGSGGASGVISFGGSPFIHNYGFNNAFLGQGAGNFTMTGPDNTALGAISFVKNTTGGLNAALGYGSLYNNTMGSYNTAIGTSAMSGNTTAKQNTAVGFSALQAMSFANGGAPWPSDNTAVGYQAMYSTNPAGPTAPTWNGIRNTAVGSGSLYANTTGYGNTAVGYNSLAANTTAGQNTALGMGALQAQSFAATSGGAPAATDNTAVGFEALAANQPDAVWDGAQNIAVGSKALWSNTTGSDNTAIGYQSLYLNTTGYNNTAVGQGALANLTSGDFNTALGITAGAALTTGTDNIYIGHPGFAAEDNTIRIGIDPDNTRTFIAGIRGVTTGYDDATPVVIDSHGQLGTINSSIRFKQDVRDMGDASSRLMELRPVTFHYKAHPDGPPQYGLIAEDVEQVMPELVVRDATGQVESVAYHEMPAMLLNELQKQQATIEQQRAELDGQKAQLAQARADIEALRLQVQAPLGAKRTPGTPAAETP